MSTPRHARLEEELRVARSRVAELEGRGALAEVDGPRGVFRGWRLQMVVVNENTQWSLQCMSAPAELADGGGVVNDGRMARMVACPVECSTEGSIRGFNCHHES